MTSTRAFSLMMAPVAIALSLMASSADAGTLSKKKAEVQAKDYLRLINSGGEVAYGPVCKSEEAGGRPVTYLMLCRSKDEYRYFAVRVGDDDKIVVSPLNAEADAVAVRAQKLEAKAEARALEEDLILKPAPARFEALPAKDRERMMVLALKKNF